MSNLRDNVSSKLADCEVLERGLNDIMAGINGLRENGGTARFTICVKGGDTFTVEVGEKIAHKFVQVLHEDFNNKLRMVQKEIDEAFDKGMLLV